MAWSILGQLKRMDSFDLVEARETFCVEGQDTLYVVDVHGGNKPRIMHLNPGDAIVHQQTTPFLVDCESVSE